MPLGGDHSATCTYLESNVRDIIPPLFTTTPVWVSDEEESDDGELELVNTEEDLEECYGYYAFPSYNTYFIDHDGWQRDLTEEGIEPNPGPEDQPKGGGSPDDKKPKTCNRCKKPGHVKKNCPSRAGKGGVSAAQNAMRDAVNDMRQREKADEDAMREKAEEDKKPVPLLKANINRQFTVGLEEGTDCPKIAVLNLVWRYLMPSFAAIYAFDILLCPVLFYAWAEYCIHAQLAFSGSLTFIVVWNAENFFVAGVLYLHYKFIETMIFRTRVARTIRISKVDTFDDDDISEEDKRPHDMSHCPRKYPNCTHLVNEIDNYFAEWDSGVKIFYGHRITSTYYISGSAFAHYAAPITKRSSTSEIFDSVRRMLAKCGFVDWDTNQIVEHNLVENTAHAIDMWKLYVDQTQDRRSKLIELLEFNPLDNDMSWTPKWYKTTSQKVATWIFLLVLIILTLKALGNIMVVTTFLANLFLWLGEYILAVGNYIASFFSFSTGKVVEVAQMVNELPKGVFGYRVDDVIAEGMKNNVIDPAKKLEILFELPKFADRVAMAAFSPLAIKGIAMPMSDRADAVTSASGLAHRGGGMTPKALPRWLDAKKRISNEVCNAYFMPLNDSELLGFEEILENTSYTLHRKQQIREWHQNRSHDFHRYTRHRETAMFDKEEPYGEFKHSRSIQGQHDRLWGTDVMGSYGRFVKTLEKMFYTIPPCTKGIDSQQVVEKLGKLGPGSKTVSDYSSYEASFSRKVKESAQFAAYDFGSKLMTGFSGIRGYSRWLVGGVNDVKNKWFKAKISHIKCSGDFDTAFSNWWDNVCSWLTVFELDHGIHWTDSINWFYCEGDDNITDDHGLKMNASSFANLGLKAKIEDNLELFEAGYCQKFVNPATGNMVGDVIRFLGRRQYLHCKFIKSKDSVKKSLCKAVAMSTLSMYPNAPGISEWAWKVYTMTSEIRVKEKHLIDVGKWEQKIQKNTTFQEPQIQIQDRLMVSHVFGFSLEQQRVLTQSIDAWEWGPLNVPLWWFPDQWVEFYTDYNTNNSKLIDLVSYNRSNEVEQWLAPYLLNNPYAGRGM